MPSFEGNLLTQWHQIIIPRRKLETLGYGEDPESLSHLALNPYRVVTDRRTDIQTENSHS